MLEHSAPSSSTVHCPHRDTSRGVSEPNFCVLSFFRQHTVLSDYIHEAPCLRWLSSLHNWSFPTPKPTKSELRYLLILTRLEFCKVNPLVSYFPLSMVRGISSSCHLILRLIPRRSTCLPNSRGYSSVLTITLGSRGSGFWSLMSGFWALGSRL